MFVPVTVPAIGVGGYAGHHRHSSPSVEHELGAPEPRAKDLGDPGPWVGHQDPEAQQDLSCMGMLPAGPMTRPTADRFQQRVGLRIAGPQQRVDLAAQGVDDLSTHERLDRSLHEIIPGATFDSIAARYWV